MAVQHAAEHTGVVVCVVSRGGSSACCGTYWCGGLCCGCLPDELLKFKNM